MIRSFLEKDRPARDVPVSVIVILLVASTGNATCLAQQQAM